MTMDDTMYRMIEASVVDGDTLSRSFDAFDSCKETAGTGSILIKRLKDMD